VLTKIVYDHHCNRHNTAFIVVHLESKGHGGPIRACPDCVREARDRVHVETERWMKTHGRHGGWMPFEGWH